MKKKKFEIINSWLKIYYIQFNFNRVKEQQLTYLLSRLLKIKK